MFGKVEHVWIANKMLRKFTLSVSNKTNNFSILKYIKTFSLHKLMTFLFCYKSCLENIETLRNTINFSRNKVALNLEEASRDGKTFGCTLEELLRHTFGICSE